MSDVAQVLPSVKRLTLLLALLLPGVQVRAGPVMDMSQVSAEASADWEFEWSRVNDLIDTLRAQNSLHPTNARVTLPYVHIKDIVLDTQSLYWESDDDALDVVLRRTLALIADLEQGLGGAQVAALRSSLQSIAQQAASSPARSAARQQLHRQACLVRRSAVLANPLLAFDEIIFMGTTTGSGGFWQGIGTMGGRGAGPIILSQWKTATPAGRKLFASGVRTPEGTTATRDLGGVQGFSPVFDLSYDGKQIVFALGTRIVRANVDGTNPVELTVRHAPSQEEFHPCWLPNGRIAYVWNAPKGDRCGGRPVPNLATMKADGTDWFPISWHETAEYHPVVDNDGKIVYSRWDYIDRGFHTAHHLWTCGPDGTDPRAPHGNYPLPHGWSSGRGRHNGIRDRPQTEYMVRPIPGAPGKYAAMAGQHHDPLYTVPVLIDTRIPDDNRMSQVKIISGTCLPFDVATCGDSIPCYPCKSEFLTLSPWPLSEDYYLVSDWDRVAIIDKFGNREVVFDWLRRGYDYRTDPRANMKDYWDKGYVFGPRPFAPRQKPPILPTRTWQGERSGTPEHKRATISVTNVYEADFAWPDSLKNITALRIVQLVPYPNTENWNTFGANHRMVLGTVPVESDGSAYFEAPVEKLIYFQALDPMGLAVQSMRSGTYVHPGEQLSCTGCHEDKWKATAPPSTIPLAMRRAPSKIQPEADGSMPLTYARLVKPVMEGTCLPCHQAKAVTSLQSFVTMESKGRPYCGQDDHWSCKWYYYYDSYGGSLNQGTRSPAGDIGARHSLMGKALIEKHQDRLTPEEFRRITLWLDCQAQIFCARRDTAAQSRGEIVWPAVEVDPYNPTGVEYLPGDDPSAPTAVSDLRATPSGLNVVFAIELSWTPATDNESGVRHYNIYRDGTLHGTSGKPRFVDGNLGEAETHTYAVAAVNLSGWEGPRSSVAATSPIDTTAPKIVALYGTPDPDVLYADFSEPIEAAGAASTANYRFGGGVTVTSVVVDSLPATTQTRVALTTAGLSDGTEYTLTLSGLRDRARAPNALSSTPAPVFTYRKPPSFKCDYYELAAAPSAIPDFSVLTPTATFTVPNFDLAVRKREDNIAMRFEGPLLVSAAGRYTFYISSDDGSKLYVDGNLLVDNDGTHGAREVADSIDLTAGAHNITVAYFNAGGGKSLGVGWRIGSGARLPFPESSPLWALEGFVPVSVHEKTPPAERTPALPRQYSLVGAGPNPFTRAVSIRVVVPGVRDGAGRRVTLEIYAANGRLVRSVAYGSLTPGNATLTFDGCDARGHSLPQGMYTCVLRAGGFARPFQIVRASGH